MNGTSLPYGTSVPAGLVVRAMPDRGRCVSDAGESDLPKPMGLGKPSRACVKIPQMGEGEGNWGR